MMIVNKLVKKQTSKTYKNKSFLTFLIFYTLSLLKVNINFKQKSCTPAAVYDL